MGLEALDLHVPCLVFGAHTCQKVTIVVVAAIIVVTIIFTVTTPLTIITSIITTIEALQGQVGVYPHTGGGSTPSSAVLKNQTENQVEIGVQGLGFRENDMETKVI